jgi:GT2 family glycosyltransferase
MGDASFRAGLARNLGVKHARGELLVFLDSDMLVPPDFLERRLLDHQQYDVIQSVRHHLHAHVQQPYVSYGDVCEKDTYVHEAPYWGAYFDALSWMSLPFFWKYTCTYALSLSREHFRKVGWFKRTFVQYGFEDTDLGYRLAKQGCRFHLCKVPTYHMASPSERVEDASSFWRRRMLLSRTAKTFYRNNLDPDVFEHFQGFMMDEWGPSVALRRIRHDWWKGSRERVKVAEQEAGCAVAESLL